MASFIGLDDLQFLDLLAYSLTVFNITTITRQTLL